MPDDVLTADVVVLGGGAAGLTVAATAASAGAAAVVVEVAPDIGGAAVLSQGVIWTAPSVDVFRQQDPHGDVPAFESMLAELPGVFEWLTDLGVEVGPELTNVLGFGIGRQIDVASFVRRSRQLVEKAGGVILVGCVAEALLTKGERVTGVRVHETSTGYASEIRAGSVVLATGGFQSSEALRDELLFPGASALPVRSIATAQGDGIRLGRQSGAALSKPTPGFYGHLVPYPMATFGPADFVPLAQYHSEHGLLVGKDGDRFTDESLGDHINAEVVARQGRALLVVDGRVRRDHVMRPFIPGMAAMDSMAAAGDRGAHYASEDSVDGLATATAEWGYNAAGVQRSIADFNAGDFPAAAPRTRHRAPLTEPPFAALEVQAAITLTYRGLITDTQGRVCGTFGPVPGLYAAGADVGGVNVWGYTGGLVRGLAMGRRIGRAISPEIPAATREGGRS